MPEAYSTPSDEVQGNVAFVGLGGVRDGAFFQTKDAIMPWLLSENPEGQFVSSPEREIFRKKLNAFHETIYFKNENNVVLNSTYNDSEITDTILCNNSKIDGEKIFQVFNGFGEASATKILDISINKLGNSEKFTGKKENSGFFRISPFFFKHEVHLIGSLEIEENNYDEIKRRIFLGNKVCIMFSFSGPLLKADTPVGLNESTTDDIFLKEDATYSASYFSVNIQSHPS
ncbi:hypothetical protein NKW44_09170 [Acetobacter lovaniensis]|uniref:hypothetical protein n=1 Tax=Acetobacter lovaniensis TaxID=104100 RepID=UPI00209E335C|nr:hypothetical protein [Acetobacter lovaniensis]MCP1239864.1 hypothetical protein [Acetobacter lovaniensis]